MTTRAVAIHGITADNKGTDSEGCEIRDANDQHKSCDVAHVRTNDNSGVRDTFDESPEETCILVLVNQI
jgi:hypothetical protein